jgi:D-alanyl-D-alanine endopeptidase (penicillin-binding protein 7)
MFHRMRAMFCAAAIFLFISQPAVAVDPLPDRLALKSSAALVLDEQTGQVLYGKNTASVLPIASITKLMTAMVVLDANLDPNELLQVTSDDVDVLKNTHSRLRVGIMLSRDEMMRLALMASENRAASVLGRNYPGGLEGFVRAMNTKARSLGLQGTHYSDPTGLASSNVSTAEDLGRLVRAAGQYERIRNYSTASGLEVMVAGRPTAFRNTNGLVASRDWDIGLSKTGFINEAGRCLVMQAKLAGRGVVIVLLDSWGKYTRIADAARIRKWLEVADGRDVGHEVVRKRPQVVRTSYKAPRHSRKVTAKASGGRSLPHAPVASARQGRAG